MRRFREPGGLGQFRRVAAVGIVWLGMQPPGRAWAETSPQVPAEVFAAQIAAAGQLAQACERDAAACDASKAPAREQVAGGAAGAFAMDWRWFAEAVAGAKTASAKDRAANMQGVRAHLMGIAAAAGAPAPASSAEFAKARRAANAALARGEFAAAEGPSWWDRQIARVQDWFLRLFTGMDRLGRRAPWLAPTIEWTCFGLAGAGLLWFVRQSLARQALRISLSEGAQLGGYGGRDSADWARMAEERAAEGDWREAVHCLYWAAIALLEGRRAWRPNAARTPREYLRLLKPGSEAQGALRELTGGFERVWYGRADADEAGYRRARASFGVLEAARPERADPAASPDPKDRGSLAVAGGV